jgi:hypothetical protein
MGLFVQTAKEGDRENQIAVGPENSMNFRECKVWTRDMLQHLAAQDRVVAGRGDLGHRLDVANVRERSASLLDIESVNDATTTFHE